MLLKKIIAFFCCLVSCASFADAPSTYYEPSVSEYKNKWLSGGDTYSTPLNTEMASGGYPHLNSQLGKYDNGSYNLQGAISLYAAREIYEHGAKICQVQIQAANAKNNDTYTWIDYYWRDNNDWESQCVKLCEPGYSGNKCETSNVQVSCDNDYIFKSTYSMIQYRDDDDEGENRHTEDMSVLKFTNQKDGTPSTKQAEHIILGVTTKLTHGAIVTPIKVTATRIKNSSGGGQTTTYSNNSLGGGSTYSNNSLGGGTQTTYTNISTISSAYSNGKITLLCQEGYVASGNKCVKTNECEKINMDKMCDGYNKDKYDESMHILKSRSEQKCSDGPIKICTTTGTCTYFECRDGLGAAPDDSTKCISCGSDIRSGITSGGVCKTCEKGEYYDKNASDFCSPAMEINKSRMERYSGIDCWMKTDKSDYKNCVI